MKAVGTIMIILGCFLFGCMQANQLKKRLKRLEMISQSFVILETQIDYAFMSILEGFEKIGHETNEPQISRFYLEMAEQLRKNNEISFSKVWKDGTVHNLCTNVLTTEDCLLIQQIGDMPLYLNKEIQLTMIRSVRTKMNERIRMIEKECKVKCKIYRVTSLAAGFMCVLLLI